MATRARADRRDVKEQFEGRVRKWEKKLVPVLKGTKQPEVRLEVLKWVQQGKPQVQALLTYSEDMKRCRLLTPMV